jgi:hypothetical protein
MHKKTIAVILLAAFSGTCWTFIVLISGFLTAYRLFEWSINSAVQTVFVQNTNLESEPSIRVLGPDNPFFKVVKNEPNDFGIQWKDVKINLENPTCRLKQLGGPGVRVMGKLNGMKEYPVTIDTGYPCCLLITDTVVADSALEIYPIKSIAKEDIGGLCHVARIDIADMSITDPPCEYLLGHYEKKVLGQTIRKEKQILFGLAFLQKFAYVLIDNVAGEIEFCAKGDFTPNPDTSWSKYPMFIEKDHRRRERLMVDVPIEGKVTNLKFDTGATAGLLIREKVWNQLSENLTVLRKHNSFMVTLGGKVPCREITVEKLQVGDSLVKSAIIFVESDKTSFLEETPMLGMGYFKNMAIVLDFQQRLLWVKNPKAH